MASMEHPMILIIDDSPADVFLLKHVLRDVGCAFHEIETGGAALAYVDSAKTLPQLVLLDMRLPGLGGLEVLETIRATPAWYNVPVVFLVDPENVEARQAARRFPFVVTSGKPATQAERETFMRLVTRVLTDGWALPEADQDWRGPGAVTKQSMR